MQYHDPWSMFYVDINFWFSFKVELLIYYINQHTDDMNLDCVYHIIQQLTLSNASLCDMYWEGMNRISIQPGEA